MRRNFENANEIVKVATGARWAVCPVCGDLNELDAEYWEAVALAGSQEAPIRCPACEAVYTARFIQSECKWP